MNQNFCCGSISTEEAKRLFQTFLLCGVVCVVESIPCISYFPFCSASFIYLCCPHFFFFPSFFFGCSPYASPSVLRCRLSLIVFFFFFVKYLQEKPTVNLFSVYYFFPPSASFSHPLLIIFLPSFSPFSPPPWWIFFSWIFNKEKKRKEWKT